MSVSPQPAENANVHTDTPNVHCVAPNVHTARPQHAQKRRHPRAVQAAAPWTDQLGERWGGGGGEVQPL
eukprot:8085296-Pyramimonas_sp.AAC.1